MIDWITQKPYLLPSGTLRNRATLLRICLGCGFLLKDANLIQFTEDGDYDEGTPGYIMQSSWGKEEVDEFSAYISKVKAAVTKAATQAR